MVEKRNIAKAIVFSILTFGIYQLYWLVKLTDDTNALAKTKTEDGSKALLYAICTFGIYTLYWFYKLGKKVDELSDKNSNSSTIYLLLGLFGLGIVNYVLAQNEINKYAEKHM